MSIGLALAAPLLSALPPPPAGPAAGGERPPAEAPRLVADVAWLADDARAGRRAGTPGEEAAARWASERFASLGLEPAGTEGWLQGFPVPLPARDLGGSRVVAEGRAWSGAEHVVPLFCSEAGTASGELAFRGYGVRDDELGWDDYAGGSVAGCVVVLVRGTPPPERAVEAAGEESASFGRAGSLFFKVMGAKRRGAAAVLVAQHPSRAQELPSFDSSLGARAGIPCAVVSAELAAALVPGYGELVAAIDAEGTGAGTLAPAPVEVALEATVAREVGTAHNVLARLPGADPARTVVVGAHIDHLGRGDTGSLAPSALGEIHNGADDNASGVAAVLEIARCLAAGPEPAGDVLFALWSGEELGLLGSDHWTERPTVPLERVRANLNLDMVGRAGDRELIVLGAGSSPAFAGWMEEAASRAGLELDVSLSAQGLGGSDHQSFVRRGIPALHLFSGVHADYHKPTDDVAGFEAEGARRVVELSLFLVGRMQATDELAFVEPDPGAEGAERGERSWSVWFGTVPDYASDERGLLLADVQEGSPAERAGLLGGDVIVRVGDIEVATIHDFVYVLQVHKPGDVVLVRYLRDGEEESVRLTLGTREPR